MINEPELSLSGRYAEFLHTHRGTQETGPAFEVEVDELNSPEFSILEENIGVTISHEGFLFLYNQTLASCMKHIGSSDEMGSPETLFLLKTTLKGLLPIIILAGAQVHFSKGEISKDSLDMIIDAAKFWNQNPVFVETLIGACLNDAPIKIIQEELMKHLENDVFMTRAPMVN